MQATAVIKFWFESTGPDKWYNGGDAFDAEIRKRFEDFCLQTAAHYKQCGTHEWEENPQTCLALILLFDQFPRNMYRGTKAAFAFDIWGLALAKLAVEKGFDLKTNQNQRAFFYMPFMHTEEIAMQDKCVRLVDMRLTGENTLFHAQEHRKLIARFGRFPYRNAVLGRTNTAEETVFLTSGGYTP